MISEGGVGRTETTLGLAVAFAARPRVVVLGTMRVGVVLVANLVEELDLVFVLEERDGDAVDRRVSPALQMGCDQY